MARPTLEDLQRRILSVLDGEMTRVELFPQTGAPPSDLLGSALQGLVQSGAIAFRLPGVKRQGARGCSVRLYRRADAAVPVLARSVADTSPRVRLPGERPDCTCNPVCGTNGYGTTIVVLCRRKEAA